ncbi:MAG: hypothetical protein J0I94_02265 [Thiobacillus sp.]|nr:hypothetical protein [Thiobacillus sp.]
MDSHRCAAVRPAVSGPAFSGWLTYLKNWAAQSVIGFLRFRLALRPAREERERFRSNPPVSTAMPTSGRADILVQAGSLIGVSRLLVTGGCVFSLVLGGCATTQPLDDADRARLATVWINPDIEVSPQMYYMGAGSSVGFLFGAVGGLATALANMSPGEQFRSFAESKGISVDRVVREEAIRAFQASGKLKLAEAPGPGAATLVIKVPIYGFSIPHGFSSRLVPAMGIECTLTDAQGKTVWRARDSVAPLGNPAEGHTMEEYRANPALIEEAWRIAARKIIADLMATL